MSYGQLVLLTNSFLVNSYFFSGQLVMSSTCTSTLLLVKYYHLFNVNTNFEDIFLCIWHKSGDFLSITLSFAN